MYTPADVVDLTTLVPSFAALLQPFGDAMTAPTFASLTTVLTGWTFARRRTVTGALACDLAAGVGVPKHHSAYHRVFAAARWSLDAVGLGLLGLVLGLALAGGGTVFLAVDDTLCRHKGRRVWGAGMHYDPLLTGRKSAAAGKAIKSRGHCWVVLGVVLPLPCRPGHYYCLPVLFRLYLNHKSARRHRTPYRTRPALARELIALACGAFPARRFHLLCDSAYAGQDTLKALPSNCDLTARWLAKAVLHAPAPAGRRPGSAGRPRVRGDRLPSPRQMLDAANGRCERVAFDTYGLRGTYRVASCRACLHAVPGRLLRVVATEPLTKGGHPRPGHRAAFYSTCVDANPERVLTWYAMRWSIEVAFRDAKQCLGLGQGQGWTEPAARRTAPAVMLLYSLVVVWFDRDGHRHYAPPDRPWYPAKPAAGFADMLATLRDQALRGVFATAAHDHSPENPFHSVLRLLKLAS